LISNKNNNFLLNICLNYGGRQEIVNVAKEIALKTSSGEIKPSEVNEELFNSEILKRGIPVQINLFENEGHGFKDGKIKVDVLKKTEAFFRQYLNI